MQKMDDILAKLAVQRFEAEGIVDPIEKAAKARDVVTGMLGFVHQFVGDDVMRAAYGEIDPHDRKEMLRIASVRVLTASALFARMPDDMASLGQIAAEAIAVSNGDAPVFFAQSPTRKRSHRVTKAKFGAFAWDAYLEGRGIELAARQDEITRAFGTTPDTMRKWLSPAREILGDDYVEYHLRKAKLEGVRSEPYSFSRSYYDAKLREPLTWQEALARDGERFNAIRRASQTGKA